MEQKLFKGLVKPLTAHVVVESRELTKPAEVREALSATEGVGWICFTDRVERIENATEIGDGVPLNAEIHRSDGTSLHVRQSASGWSLYDLAEHAEPASDSVEVRAFDHAFVADRSRGGGRLRYRVYWRRTESGTAAEVRVWEPWFAAFRGWEDEEDGR